MRTRITDVTEGSWFVKSAEPDGERFVKTLPFLRGNSTYEAVSLTTGHPAFLSPSNQGVSPHIAYADIDIVDKPDWATPMAEWDIRFDRSIDRDATEARFKDRFSTVKVWCKDRDGSFYLVYRATPAVHGEIKSAFGG